MYDFQNNFLKIAGTEPQSIVDGPGIRYTIFTQGCDRNCPGCHNPQTHDKEKGYLIDVNVLYNEIIRDPLLQGVTISGGEPFLQVPPLLILCKKLKKRNFNIICYTGYLFEQLKNNIYYCDLLNYIDYLIDGPFDISLRDIELNFRGSSNQRIIDIKETCKNNELVCLDNIIL